MDSEERKFLFGLVEYSWTVIPLVLLVGFGMGKLAKEYYPEQIKKYQELENSNKEVYFIDVNRDGVAEKIIVRGEKIEVYKGLGNGKFGTENIFNQINFPKENSLERKSKEDFRN